MPKKSTDTISNHMEQADFSGPLAYSIPDLAHSTSIGKTSLYAEAKAGRLKLTRLCGRTIVLAEDARAWLQSGVRA